MNQYVSGVSLIIDVIARYPETKDFLMNIGFCQYMDESILDECLLLGFDTNIIVDNLNEVIGYNRGNEY